MEEIKITVTRARTNRIEIRVDTQGKVTVKAPLYESEEKIRAFVASKQSWIEKHVSKMREREQAAASLPAISKEQQEMCVQKALKVFPERSAHFAAIMGVTYGRITIRDQKTRWGSCSAKGNLNYNWRLILAPDRVLDYVVVHELAHRKQMNHSPLFWKEVEKVMPDYKAQRKWLKDNGWMLTRAGKDNTDGE